MSKQKNKLRIISGTLGSRTITFTEVEGLRPTLDRVRETLFNWLQADIINANCLDLFAGSGALGFEAASRGAKHITLVETNKTVCNKLKDNIQQLKLTNVIAQQQTAQNFIKQNTTAYNIVFIDPPFAMKGIESLPNLIENSAIIKNGTLIYLECSSKQTYQLPPNWQKIKNKKMGDVTFQLLQRQPKETEKCQ